MTPVRLVAWLLLWMACQVAAAAGEAVDVATDAALEARVNAVAAELRCLVCQNQSLADSHAELALQLKGQVRDQLRAGRSADQVITYMTERYGDFVRYRPPWKASTVLLWVGPLLFVLAGLAVLRSALRRRPREAPPLSDDERDRATALLEH